jgi:hypothetical protein
MNYFKIIAFYSLFVGSVFIYPQIKSVNKIVFLEFVMTKSSINLFSFNVVDGTLTNIEPSAGEMTYELVDSTGNVLRSGFISNPLCKIYEYEDPQNNGVLKSITVNLEKSRFILRLPYSSEFSSINFYKFVSEQSTAILRKGNAPLQKELIATVNLNNTK